MARDTKRRHVFISHHHRDDGSVDKLSSLVSRGGYDLRNSSIRVNPRNQDRLFKKKVSDETIKRLLRMKISWSSTVVVLIGKGTHSREWVNWEIEQAHKMGKRIIGVYERGGTENDIPPNFERYGSSLQAWNSSSIMKAIDGDDNSFQKPDGSLRLPVHNQTTMQC